MIAVCLRNKVGLGFDRVRRVRDRASYAAGQDHREIILRIPGSECVFFRDLKQIAQITHGGTFGVAGMDTLQIIWIGEENLDLAFRPGLLCLAESFQLRVVVEIEDQDLDRLLIKSLRQIRHNTDRQGSAGYIIFGLAVHFADQEMRIVISLTVKAPAGRFFKEFCRLGHRDRLIVQIPAVVRIVDLRAVCGNDIAAFPVELQFFDIFHVAAERTAGTQDDKIAGFNGSPDRVMVAAGDFFFAVQKSVVEIDEKHFASRLHVQIPPMIMTDTARRPRGSPGR